MEESGRVFRSAMRGFHRQDVLDFIEQMTRDRAKERAEAAGEISRCQAELAKKEQEIETLQKEREEMLAGEEAGLAALRAEASAAQAALYEKIERLETENAALAAEKQALSARLGALLDMEKEYRAVKDKLTEIELSAHRRAKDVAQQAEENALEIKKRAEGYIRDARAALIPLLQSAEEQKQRAEDAFAAFRHKMAELKGGVDSVAATIRSLSLPKEAGNAETFESEAPVDEAPAEENAPPAVKEAGISELIQRLRAKQLHGAGGSPSREGEDEREED